MEVARSELIPKPDFEVGQRVTFSPDCIFANDWRGEWIVVAIMWDVRTGGRWDIAIQSEDEIKAGYGWTDGWHPDDLLPVPTHKHKGDG